MPGPSAQPSIDPTKTPVQVICPQCAKVLDDEPNFCPACGGDLRGMGGSSDTLDGPTKNTIDGRYKVLEKLGEGGMGSVFKVEHVRMGKIAALKLLRPDHAVDKGLKARFLQEARVVAKLSHPNTVQVFDSGELDDGSLFITMEYVPGKDLAWQLRAHGAMSENKAISIAIQVLNSLQEAHEAGIVHRDIKPANIMLVRRRRGGEDQVKLLDFGIAKLQEAEGRKSTTGDFVGTPAYMSPEQIRGENVDARSDLYSVGALLFELVTGRQLFIGPTPISIITQHTEAAVPHLADINPSLQVSPGFEAVIRRALSKRASDRFLDADDMRVALEGLRKELGVTPNDFTPVPTELAEKMLSREDFDRFERGLRVRRTLWPIVVLAVLVAVPFAGYRMWSNRPPPETSTHEIEPNDSPHQATRVLLGTDIQGAIGASRSETGDRDLYVLKAPLGTLKLTLTGVADLNLTVEVLQLEKSDEGEKLRRRVFLDESGLGEGERIDGLQSAAGDLYVRIEERPFHSEPNRPPRERALVPYTLRLEALEGGSFEAEPNDSPATAQALPLTRALVGFLGVPPPSDDITRPDAPFSTFDYYRYELDEGQVGVLLVVPPERGAVMVTPVGGKKRFEVKGAPGCFDSKAARMTYGLVAGKDALPGDTYDVAVATTGENGLAAASDVLSRLREAGRDTTRKRVIECLQTKLGSSSELSRLMQEE